jgi:hypothetical protein
LLFELKKTKRLMWTQIESFFLGRIQTRYRCGTAPS